MPAKKRPFGGSFVSKKRKQAGRKPYIKKTRFIRQPNVPLQRCFIKCIRIAHHTPASPLMNSSGTVLTDNMKFDELKDVNKFNRFASMFSYFRVHSMKIVVNATGHMPILITSWDPDTDTVSAAAANIQINTNCRSHQLLDGKVTSRSQNLQLHGKYRDLLSTQGAFTTLQEEAYKSCIQYAFMGLSGTHWNATVTQEWVVEFQTLRDQMFASNATMNMGLTGLVSGTGPQNNPPYDTTNP